MAIFEYINGFYNPRRRHSALDCKSPVAFERKVSGTNTRKLQRPAASLGPSPLSTSQNICPTDSLSAFARSKTLLLG
jgi:hypothetical protein